MRQRYEGTAEERRIAKHKTYNASPKGARRNKRYEAKHPERKLRWEGSRNALRKIEGIA